VCVLALAVGCGTEPPSSGSASSGSRTDAPRKKSEDIHRGSSGATLPEFGLGYFKGMSPAELMKLWASDDPNVRNMSAQEVSRRIWNSDDSVALLKELMPEIKRALQSENPNSRRAVADMVNGLVRAGGKYTVLSVRITDQDKINTFAVLRKELGALLPIVCKNIADDPHMWARAGACDLAAKIIPPYRLPADGLYEEYAKKIRPLLVLRAHDDDRFMQQAAGRALKAIGIDGLPAEDVTKAMFVLIDTQISQSCTEAFGVLALLSDDDLAKAVPFLLETVKSDAIDANHSKPGVDACKLLLRSGVPEAPAAVVDYATRERHGQHARRMELFPVIRKFTDEQIRSALPQLRRFALMQEVAGRREVQKARGVVARLGNKKPLESIELIELTNAKEMIASPPHQWILDLFTKVGETPPKVGIEVTGPNPVKTARTTIPPWIPKEKGERVALTEADGLAGTRAMDTLPGRKADVLPLDETAFSKARPETNCSNLTVQIAHPKIVLRRPMGPTGILGTFSNRRIYVVGTQPGSPSHGKVSAGDWIVGVNDRYFTRDPRVGMGWAIEQSEGRPDGSMQLNVVRKGAVIDVTINLEPLGRHVSTWPYNCEKSRKIFDRACEFIARHDGNWVIPGALVLLAAGDDRYMPEVRKAAYELADKGPGTSNWFLGYQLILLSEYYQRTGDSGILPAITTFAERITSGQTYPGGYLHNVSRYNEWNMASKIGYGEMNMAGVPCLVGLVLANECGVDLNHNAFRKSIDYFEIFSGRGVVPYGAHAPYVEGAAAGGKSAIAGVAFDLLGRGERAKPFVEMSATAHEYMWTGYHGATYWNATWRPLSASRAEAQAFETLAKQHTWRFNLARHWHGGMSSPGRGEAEFAYHHNPVQSPAYALIYALPRKSLRLTGAPRSVFTRIDTPRLKELKRIYDTHDVDALQSAVERLQQSPGATDSEKVVAKQLVVAAERNRKTFAAERGRLEAALKAGDFHTAEWMITAMNKAGVGVKDDDPKRALLDTERRAIDAGTAFHSTMRKLVTGPFTFQPSDCAVLANLAAGAGYYAGRAREMMRYFAVPAGGAWPETKLAEAKTVSADVMKTLFYLISPSHDEIRRLRMKTWVTDVGGAHPVDDLAANPDLEGWYEYDYDDSKWDDAIGPYILHEKRGYEHEGHVLQRLKFHAKHVYDVENLYLKALLGPRYFSGTIYLNGQAIMEFSQSPCGGGRSRGHRKLGQQMAFIQLPEVAKTLLVEGNNILAVRADVPPISNWSHGWLRTVDIGLAAAKRGGGTWSYDPLVAGE
jgi:hypothetical protein